MELSLAVLLGACDCEMSVLPPANRSPIVPRYYFHTQTDMRLTDPEGLELRGDTEARAEAIKACGEMVRDAPHSFWGSRPWTVTVTNGAGFVLYEVSMDGHATPIAP
jgi:hypothetical protein